MNRKAFNRINYGLFLVGSVLEGKYQGCVVNSLHQITSSNPAKFSGSFAATVLERGTPKELVDLFGYKSGRVVNKYEGFQVETDGAGNPYLKDHALARISCKIVDKLDLGSYVLFVCEATEAEVLGEGAAMTLDDYRGEGGATPAAATVVRIVEEVAWRCTICGYIAERETLPDDYRCPI